MAIKFVHKIRDTLGVRKSAMNSTHYQSGQDELIAMMYQAFGWYGYQPQQTWYQLVNSYTSYTFTVINKIAQTIASTPQSLVAYQKKSSRKWIRGSEAKALMKAMPNNPRQKKLFLKENSIDKVTILDHPFNALMGNPNPLCQQFQFWYETSMRLELAGDCGWLKEDRSTSGVMRGIPQKLWVLPLTWTGQLKPIPDIYKVVRAFLYLDQDKMTEYPLEDIVYFRLPHPKGPFEGMSGLKAQLYPYSVDQYIGQALNNLFKNGIMAGNVFETEQPLQNLQQGDLLSDLKAGFQGAKNAGKTMILTNGLKVGKNLVPPLKDFNLEEINNNVRDKFMASYDVSAGMLGLVDKQNRSNLDTVSENFETQCIAPRTVNISQTVKKYLLSTEYGDGLELEFQLRTFESPDDKLKEKMWNLSSGKHTINEERAVDGEAPVAWGDLPLITNTMQPLDPEIQAAKKEQILNPPEPPKEPASGQPPANKPEPDAEPDKNKAWYYEEKKIKAQARYAMQKVCRVINLRTRTKADSTLDVAWKQQIGVMWDGCIVYLVYGKYVRQNINAEFEGGHSWAYDFIGTREKPEIWVERLDSTIDTMANAVHEMYEYTLMRYGVIAEYDVAHDATLSVESITRSIDPMSTLSSEGATGSEHAGKSLPQIKAFTKAYWTEEMKVAEWKAFDNRATSYEPKIKHIIISHFKNQEQAILDRLPDQSKKILGHMGGFGQTKRREWLKNNKSLVDDINIDPDEEAAKLQDEIIDTIKHAITDSAGQRLNNLHSVMDVTGVEFNVNDPRVKKWLGNKLAKFSKQIEGTTFDQVRAVLREGFAEGKPTTTIASELRQKFDSFEQYRANLIARTESTAAANIGDLEAVKQADLGDMLLKSWLSSRDDKVRDDHEQAEDDYEDGIEIDELFDVGGDKMDAPGDGSDADENVNCRCGLIYRRKKE